MTVSIEDTSRDRYKWLLSASLLVGHLRGEDIDEFCAWFLATSRFCCGALASHCIVGRCGGATESGVGGRMCDGVLGLHVAGVTVYRETTREDRGFRTSTGLWAM